MAVKVVRRAFSIQCSGVSPAPAVPCLFLTRQAERIRMSRRMRAQSDLVGGQSAPSPVEEDEDEVEGQAGGRRRGLNKASSRVAFLPRQALSCLPPAYLLLAFLCKRNFWFCVARCRSCKATCSVR